MQLEIAIGDSNRPALAFKIAAADYGDALRQVDERIRREDPKLANAPINFKPVRKP